MMKKLLTLVLLGTISTVNAQDKAINVVFKEKYKHLYHDINENGDVIFVSGDYKSSKKAKVEINRYDSNLELVYSKDVVESDYKGLSAFFGRGMDASPIDYDFYLSKTGDLTVSVSDSMVIDKSGNSKRFQYRNEFKNFRTATTAYHKDFAFYFGYKIDPKSDDLSKEMYVKRISLNDFSKNTKEFTLPPFPQLFEGELYRIFLDESKAKREEYKKKTIYEVGNSNNENLLMVNKLLSEDLTKNQYNLTSVDADWNVVKRTSFAIELKDGKFFALSNNGLSGYKMTYYQSAVTTHRLFTEMATGNVYVEGPNEDFYYVYGVYAKKKAWTMNAVYPSGFYVHKFNTKGELIWKLEKELANKENEFDNAQNAYWLDLRFFKINEKEIVVSIYNPENKLANFITMDPATGKIQRCEDIKVKMSNAKLMVWSGNEIKTGIVMKDLYGKNNLDINTLIACKLNKNVREYLKRDLETERDFNGYITKTGIVLLENNREKKTYKILKFNF
ncbi:hypothetical protein [Flavobacterium sp.]|uniref:hypothetical protein n=1 Tax=Flavobacterium sp. TaxID=239 RepID=UPI003D6C6E7E